MFLSDRVTTSRSASLLLLSAGAIVATFAIVLWTSSLPTSSSSLLQSDGAKVQRILMMVSNDQDDKHQYYMNSMEAMAMENTLPAAISSSFHRFNRDLQESSSVPIDPVLFSGSGDDFYCELLDDGLGDEYICLRTIPSIAGTSSPPTSPSWFFPYRDYEGFFACICKLPLEPGVPNFDNKNCEYCNVIFQIAGRDGDDPNYNDKTYAREYLPCLSSSFTNPTTSTDSYTIQFDCSNVFRLIGFDHEDEPCVGVDENGECFSLVNVPAPTHVASTYTIPQPPQDGTFCSEEPFESMNTEEERYQGRHICPTYTGFPYPDTQARTVFLCKDDIYEDDLDCICEIYMEFYSRETMCQSCTVHSNGSDESLNVSFDCSNLFVGPSAAILVPLDVDRSFIDSDEDGGGGNGRATEATIRSSATVGGDMSSTEGLSRRMVIAIAVSILVAIVSMITCVTHYCFDNVRMKPKNGCNNNNNSDQDMNRIHSFFGTSATTTWTPQPTMPPPTRGDRFVPRSPATTNIEIDVPALRPDHHPATDNSVGATTEATTNATMPCFFGINTV